MLSLIEIWPHCGQKNQTNIRSNEVHVINKSENRKINFYIYTYIYTRGDYKQSFFDQLHAHILERQQNIKRRDIISLLEMNAPCARAICGLKYFGSENGYTT